MKLIETTAELLPFIAGEDGIYKMIERAGRTCYKSIDKMTDDSAKPFVERMIKSGHTAMLEHGTVYLKTQSCVEDTNFWIIANSPYAKVVDDDISSITYITTNLRAVIELFPTTWHGFLGTYMCEPTEYHEKRYTFRLITSIGVTRELNRHRVNSIAEQSTRYCNYAKDKFGNELTFVMPVWYDTAKYDSYKLNEFDKYLERAEQLYMFYIDCGMQPQEAREVLPLCTATEIVHTAFASDWRHFFDLRLFAKTGNPHPNMLLLAQKMKAEAENKDVWNDIMRYHSKF